jgi:GT2 family glycosyltransferase
MLSVVIVNWNTREFLHACLSSLREFPPRAMPMEVIVIDNASSDGSAAMVKAEFSDMKLIESGGNLGYAKGNNLGLEAAQGEWLLTLNPDTEVFAETLDLALKSLTSRPEVGVLGAKQLHPDEGVQRSIRGFPTFKGLVNDVLGWGEDTYRLRQFDYETAQPAPQPMGTFLLFRREALEAVGGRFDEQFPIFFNEVDLLYRMKQKGWGAFYDPEVRVKHFGGASTRQVRKSMIWESHRSLVRYFDKHHPSVFGFLRKGLIFAAALVRARGVHAGFRP